MLLNHTISIEHLSGAEAGRRTERSGKRGIIQDAAGMQEASAEASPAQMMKPVSPTTSAREPKSETIRSFPRSMFSAATRPKTSPPSEGITIATTSVNTTLRRSSAT